MFARPNRLCSERCASWLLMVAVWLLFFWPALSGQKQFGFRDTGNMYFPMFRWIDQQWQSGHTPFWNPLGDFGVSVAGDTSSSLFYPGKSIFVVRYFSFDIRFAWYVSLHVLLAAAGGWSAARSTGCRPLACSLAGTSYAFGGTVLFQSCNVVYLVGAAWLPFALAGILQYSRSAQNEIRWLVLAAISLAMMVLGGDPQMAFMTGLISLPLIWFAPEFRSRRQRFLAPILLAVGGLALSAVQIIASWYWLQGSERSALLANTSIWGSLMQGDFSGLIGEPVPGSHAAAIYEFSFAPWRVLESVWPNFFGKFDFVSESVWASQLAGADRLWTPSIYFGVAVLCLAMVRMVWRRPSESAWKLDWQLTWLMSFFLVGSFGWYGVGWFVNEIQLMRGGNGIGSEISRPLGGIYWWLVTWVPGFASFRYPAKLLTVAALAASLLGGRGLDSLISDSRRMTGLRITRLAIGTGIIGALVAAIVYGIDGRQTGLTPVSITEILTSLVHTTIVLGVFCWLIRFRSAKARKVVGWAILLLSAVDLWVANHGLTGFVSRDKSEIKNESPSETVYRNPEIDHQLIPSNGPITLNDLNRLDRMTSRPRVNWLMKQRVVGSFASIEQLDNLAWKLQVSQLSETDRRTILESAGATQTIDSVSWQTGSSGQSKATIVRKPIQGLPRFRLVDSWSILTEIDDRDPLAVAERTSEILKLQIANGTEFVVIENDRLLAGDPLSTPASPGRIGVVSETSTRIVLDIVVNRDCLLLANDYFDPHWKALVSKTSLVEETIPVLRANRLMRAIPVSAGSNRVTFVYHPPGLWSGLVISGLSWLTAIALLLKRPGESGVIMRSGLPERSGHA